MNAEIAKMRKLRNNDEIIEHNPVRISERRMLEMIKELNTNYRSLFELQQSGNVDINEFVDKTIANIYIVLNMFNEMGIYPDYFYDAVVKMNVDYQKTVGSGTRSLRGNYDMYRKVDFSARLSKIIREGFEKGYNRLQAYPKKDINDAFLEMLTFFESFDIPFIGELNKSVDSKEHCSKVFNELKYNHTNIIDNLLNSDYIFEDVEYLARLLFEYISFFAAMGINPKDYLDECINRLEGGKRK